MHCEDVLDKVIKTQLRNSGVSKSAPISNRRDSKHDRSYGPAESSTSGQPNWWWEDLDEADCGESHRRRHTLSARTLCMVSTRGCGDTGIGCCAVQHTVDGATVDFLKLILAMANYLQEIGRMRYDNVRKVVISGDD
jgi:hypothetical protein